MKATEWKNAVRPILPADQAWGFRGTLCYRLPMEWVATGVFGQGSAYTKDVYIYRFVMPLFQPTEFIYLSWGERVGRGQTYGLDDLEAFHSVVRSALTGGGSEQAELARLASAEDTPNHGIIEVRGYALILRGDQKRALSSLATVAGGGPARLAWHQEMIDRAKLMSDLLRGGGLDAAVGQLGRWRDQTCVALGLKRAA